MGVSKFRSGAIDETTPTKLSGILAGDGAKVITVSQQELGLGMYGVCSTAASTVAKTASISGLTALATGLTIRVKFTNRNSATNPTLNVNSLGAVAIKKYGTTSAGSGDWEAGAVIILVYDGTYWQMAGAMQNIPAPTAPFYVGTTAPSNTSVLWIDTNNGLKYYNGSAWVTCPVGYSS